MIIYTDYKEHYPYLKISQTITKQNYFISISYIGGPSLYNIYFLKHVVIPNHDNIYAF
jgi:hypothetical protein